MATALPTPSSSSNNKHWWPRISSNKEPLGSTYGADSSLHPGGFQTKGGRPHTATGASRPSLMTSVTNAKSTPSNAFMSPKPSSRFNFAAVIGFGSKSKKQQPVDIQDPPSQVRSLPNPKTSSHTHFGVMPASEASLNPRLSRGVASSTSGTSRASTDGPLTPADETASGSRISYQHSLMTLTDLSDPFATTSPLSDRRSSAHSDKSISKRLMHKVDGKASKTVVRLPVGEGSKRKDSRDRSATLPSRVRSANDATEAYQPLRAVEPPWAPDTSAEAPSVVSESWSTEDRMKTVRGLPPIGGTILKSRSIKPGLPWPDSRTHATTSQGVLQGHQRTHSSSSLSKEYLPEGSRPNNFRASTNSSSRNSASSSMYTSSFSLTSNPSPLSDSPSDVRYPAVSSRIRTASNSASNSAQTTPIITTQFSRSGPRPPPTTGLPPTPSTGAGSSSPSHLHPPSPVTDQHSLRERSGTAASSSALSFTSSLSSLSFNSRPSPQDPPSRGAYDYPSLIGEPLPLPSAGTDEKRGSNSGSSLSSNKDLKMKRSSNGSQSGPVQQPVNKIARSELTPRLSKINLPNSRPLPSPPVQPPPQGPLVNYNRERAMSATSSTFSLTSETGRTLRKQRSFHNTSNQAPTPVQPSLRHYSSFDPSAPSSGSGHLRSPPLPPQPDLPPMPPPSTPSTGKRSSAGKEQLTSPKRKLFGAYKGDRRQEPENMDTSISASASNSGHHQTLHHSSSWFDDHSPGPEPPSASSASVSAHDVAQHIVPPAELLRMGAAWEQEAQTMNGLRRTKSSWGSRDSDGSRTSYTSTSSRLPLPRSAGSGSPSNLSSGSKLPRSTSLLSKATSAPSFTPSRGAADISFATSSSSVTQESYTSLSPPPRRARPPASTLQGLGMQPQSRRTLSNVTATSGPTPPRGALIERKPSFLDMSARQSVTLDVPELADRDEPERDSFLELSRGVDSIDTIRESIDSVDSFMQ